MKNTPQQTKRVNLVPKLRKAAGSVQLTGDREEIGRSGADNPPGPGANSKPVCWGVA